MTSSAGYNYVRDCCVLFFAPISPPLLSSFYVKTEVSRTNVASVGGVLNDTRKVLTPDEGPSLETSIFPLSFQVVREPFTFRVSKTEVYNISIH